MRPWATAPPPRRARFPAVGSLRRAAPGSAHPAASRLPPPRRQRSCILRPRRAPLQTFGASTKQKTRPLYTKGATATMTGKLSAAQLAERLPDEADDGPTQLADRYPQIDAPLRVEPPPSMKAPPGKTRRAAIPTSGGRPSPRPPRRSNATS